LLLIYRFNFSLNKILRRRPARERARHTNQKEASGLTFAVKAAAAAVI
jgi:hypothetical protein